MVVELNQFAGMQPRLDPMALADSQASLALNCRLKSTKICPIKEALTVTDYSINVEGGLTDAKNAGTLYLWTRGRTNRNFLAWPGFVHFAHSNLNADKRYRVFVTGETGYPVVPGDDTANQPIALVCSEDGAVYDRHLLYMEVPEKMTGIVRSDATALNTDNLRYTTFCQTYVDEYGYESGASDPSDEVQYNDGDGINIPAISAPSWAVKRRIYKAVAGTAEDTIRFVFEQDASVGGGFSGTVVAVKDEDTGEVMPTVTPIPKDLDWMTAMPGNFYVGFLRSEPRRVCFSDVDLPTSWPDVYRYDIRDEAIGIAVGGSTAFVLTTGYPWAISGSAPEGMTASQIVSEQACVSAHSICALEGKVFYASQDGVCMLSEDSLMATVITRAYWDKATWSALWPKNITMCAYDNALFLFTHNNAKTEYKSFILDFDIGQGLIIQQISDKVNCVCMDCENDALYFVKGA